MRRMWESSRFHSPKELQLGSVMDEVTNVYTVGATAFALFSNDHRTQKQWQLNKELFTAATRAVCADRSQRQSSIR